jgi:deoxyribonuclease V
MAGGAGPGSGVWPGSAAELVSAQRILAGLTPEPWRAGPRPLTGGCFVCFRGGLGGAGQAGDPGWAAAAAGADVGVTNGVAGAAYEQGLLALREGPLLQAAVRGLPRLPDVLVVDATGRDHPRRAGLALHLGHILDLPTVGVTQRPLLAAGAWPGEERGAVSPLTLEGQRVGFWVRTVSRRRPLAVHAAWRTDAETAVEVVLACAEGARTPEPLRRARSAARAARAAAGP